MVISSPAATRRSRAGHVVLASSTPTSMVMPPALTKSPTKSTSLLVVGQELEEADVVAVRPVRGNHPVRADTDPQAVRAVEAEFGETVGGEAFPDHRGGIRGNPVPGPEHSGARQAEGGE